MKSWSPKWLIGWAIILLVALIYELTAFAFELSGIASFPTLSSIIVGLIPLRVLEPLTIIIALILMWHWWDLKRRHP